MSNNYKPTCNIKWVRVDGNYVDGERPLAQIAGYRECGPQWYCLKQLWVSDIVGESDEWRNVEAVE